jgi:hypothetical protein
MSRTLTSQMDGEITPDQARRALAEAIKGEAEWRRKKADEYPDDRRNTQAANGLEELAAYVLTLPEDDPRLRDLTALAGGKDVFVFGQQASQTLSRFRFAGPGEEFDDFLEYLVSVAAEDEIDLARLAGAPPLAIAYRLRSEGSVIR